MVTSGPIGSGLKRQAQLVGTGGGDDAGVDGSGPKIVALLATWLWWSLQKIESSLR